MSRPGDASGSTLSSLTNAASDTYTIAREAVLTPFSTDHRRGESIKILSDCELRCLGYMELTDGPWMSGRAGGRVFLFLAL